MQIEIRLFAGLRKYYRGGPGTKSELLELPDGSTLGDIVDTLGISQSQSKLTIVNATHRPLDWPLNDGDKVSIFPPIAGG